MEKQEYQIGAGLTELIKISRRVGRDPHLTCGASGNTSVKTDDGKFMFVKASGTALADMSAKRGWCKINLQKVLRWGMPYGREIIKDKKLSKLSSKKREIEIAGRLLAACEDKKYQPSIESNLHAFLDKCVIHLHPTVVGAFINSKNGKAELEKMFGGENLAPLFVSYANPGYCLAKKIAKLTFQYQKKYKHLPQILFLEKHGLFVSAQSSKKALQLVLKVIKRCGKKLTCPGSKKIKKPAGQTVRDAKQAIREAFFAATGEKKPVHFFHNKIISTFADRTDTGRLLKAGPLNPNEIIYCNGPAIWVENLQKEKIVFHLKKKKPPIAFLVKNIGLFVVGSKRTASTAEQVVLDSLFTRYNARRLGGIVALTKSEQNFIRNYGG